MVAGDGGDFRVGVQERSQRRPGYRRVLHRPVQGGEPLPEAAPENILDGASSVLEDVAVQQNPAFGHGWNEVILPHITKT